MACGKCGAKRGHLPGCDDWGKGKKRKHGEDIPRERKKWSRDDCPPHNPVKVGYNKKSDTWRYRCSRCRRYLGAW